MSTEIQTDHKSGAEREHAVTAYLRQECQEFSREDIETNLQAAGLLPKLEQAGIIPGEDDLQQREQALRRVYIGALIDSLQPNILVVPVVMYYPDAPYE